MKKSYGKKSVKGSKAVNQHKRMAMKGLSKSSMKKPKKMK